MKIKIVCFVVGALLICSFAPIIQASGIIKEFELKETQEINGYMLIGFMRLIDEEESRRDFEVVRIVMLRGYGETIKLEKGEMIEIQGSIFCVIFNDFIFGYIGDFAFIN